MDFKHPTNVGILLLIFLLIMALLVVIYFILSGDIYNLNCKVDCWEQILTEVNL